MRYDFEVLAEFDVVWSGKDELLPPRATIPDGRWEDVPVILLGDKETIDRVKPKRRYRKCNLDFWSKRLRPSELPLTNPMPAFGWRGRRPQPLPDRPAGAQGPAAVAGVGTGPLGVESVSHPPHDPQ